MYWAQKDENMCCTVRNTSRLALFALSFLSAAYLEEKASGSNFIFHLKKVESGVRIIRIKEA